MYEPLNLALQYLKTFFLIIASLLELLMSSLTPYCLKNKKSVEGEIVLVTGGGNGFGRLLAIKFAILGSRVVIWDVDKQGNDETCRLVKGIGGQIDAYILDVSDRDKVYETAKLVKQQVGEVTILVNNAGIVQCKPFLDTSDALLDKVMQVNTMAHFWTLKAFLPSMFENDHGHIVCVSSAAGLCGIPRLSAYSASKQAVIGLMESICGDLIEAEKIGVNVTMVFPSFSRTSMWEGEYDGLLAEVDPDTVAEEIIKGVLINKQIVCVPKIAFSLAFLKVLVKNKTLYDLVVPFVGKGIMKTVRIKKVFKEQELE